MKTARRTLSLALACALLCAAAASAQDTKEAEASPAMSPEQQAMMEAWQKAGAVGPQHAQLAEHFAGNWNTKQTMWMDPSQPPMVETGKSVDTAVLEGRQIQTQFKGQVMGQPFTGIGFTGYDNVRGKYTSTWTDSMSTGVMVSDGEYDPATKTYTFRGQMADPTKQGALIPIRETIRIVDADHHVMEMFEPHDGKEVRTMQIEYTRAD
ncbi:MAG TPA: DUF1579 domain-containing protein [Luteimonas sp.]|nr:DUF1579 domain-containing protein [Luteimonas sp.]